MLPIAEKTSRTAKITIHSTAHAGTKKILADEHVAIA